MQRTLSRPRLRSSPVATDGARSTFSAIAVNREKSPTRLLSARAVPAARGTSSTVSRISASRPQLNPKASSVRTGLVWAGSSHSLAKRDAQHSQSSKAGNSWQPTLARRLESRGTSLPPVDSSALSQRGHRICRRRSDVLWLRIQPPPPYRSRLNRLRYTVRISSAARKNRMTSPASKGVRLKRADRWVTTCIVHNSLRPGKGYRTIRRPFLHSYRGVRSGWGLKIRPSCSAENSPGAFVFIEDRKPSAPKPNH